MASTRFIRDCLPVELITKCGAELARVECAQCGIHTEWHYPARMPPEGIKRHFTSTGWALRNRSTCPACIKRKKEQKPMVTVAQIKSAPAPSFDAKAARRDAHELIAITFDIPTGQYRDEYSDERIAKETGVSIEWVKQRREDEFGPMKEPDELAQMRKQLADAAEAVAEIKARFEKLCTTKGWAA